MCKQISRYLCEVTHATIFHFQGGLHISEEQSFPKTIEYGTTRRGEEMDMRL
jgi:hypothetical protein